MAFPVKLIPTPIAAALAGAFSAIVWPFLWSRFGGSAATGSIELIVATLLVIGLPAHACVLGFGHNQAATGRALDTALLKRIGAWLGAAIITALVGAALRA